MEITIILFLVMVAGIGVFAFVRSFRMTSSTKVTSINSNLTASELEENALSEAPPVELHFGPSPNEPVVSIRSLSAIGLPADARKVNIADSKIDQLSPMLQLVPNVLTTAEFSSGNYMKVIVNGPLAKTADGQAFLPYVKNEHGRVKELARLKDPTSLSNMVNAAMVFQIASVVVAQKHLADISKKLDDIKQGVSKISAFQLDKRKSGITGAIKYFEQAAPAILQGEMAPEVRQRLEDYDGTLISIQDHLIFEITRETEAIENLKDPDKFGSEGMKKAISDQQQILAELHGQWALCLRARTSGWQLLLAFPEEPILKQSRQDSIESSIGEMMGDDGLLHHMDQHLKAKIDGLKAFWSTQKILDARKAELRTWTREHIPKMQQATKVINQQITQGETMLLDQSNPVTLAIKLEGNHILEAYELKS